MKFYYDSNESEATILEVSNAEMDDYSKTLGQFCLTMAIFVDEFLRMSVHQKNKKKLREDILHIMSLWCEIFEINL